MAYRTGPEASRLGLCVIDRGYFRVYHVSKNWEVLVLRKYTEYNLESKKPSYRYIFVVQELPNSLTRDLATPISTLSIAHSPRPRQLTAGPTYEMPKTWDFS